MNAKLAKIATGQRDQFEAQFVREELEENSYRLKVLAGPGEGANAYERECFSLMREVYDLESQVDRINAELTTVTGYTTEVDAEGKPQPQPVYLLSREARAGREATLADLRRQISLLEGREGAKRRSDAAAATAAQIAQQNDQLAIMKEAKAKATDMLRQARVDELAAAFAKGRQHSTHSPA